MIHKVRSNLLEPIAAATRPDDFVFASAKNLKTTDRVPGEVKLTFYTHHLYRQ